MKTQSKGWDMAVYALLMTALLILTLVFSACSDDSQTNSGASIGFGNKDSILDGGKGIAILLAKDLIASNVNPFLNKLPITADAQEEAQANPPGQIGEGPTEAAAPPADPFEGVALVGISFSPKNSYALVTTPGGAGSQVVREGDVLTTDSGASLKISKIKQDQVDMQANGSASAVRTLVLPDIVGFNNTNANGGESPSQGARSSARRPSNSEHRTSLKTLHELTGEQNVASSEPQATSSETSKKSSILKLDD